MQTALDDPWLRPDDLWWFHLMNAMCASFSSSPISKKRNKPSGMPSLGAGMGELNDSDLTKISGGLVNGSLVVNGAPVSRVFLALNSPFDPTSKADAVTAEDGANEASEDLAHSAGALVS
jgi:hypothetical protein